MRVGDLYLMGQYPVRWAAEISTAIKGLADYIILLPYSCCS